MAIGEESQVRLFWPNSKRWSKYVTGSIEQAEWSVSDDLPVVA